MFVFVNAKLFLILFKDVFKTFKVALVKIFNVFNAWISVCHNMNRSTDWNKIMDVLGYWCKKGLFEKWFMNNDAAGQCCTTYLWYGLVCEMGPIRMCIEISLGHRRVVERMLQCPSL